VREKQKKDWRKAILPLDATLYDAAQNLTDTALKICVIIDGDNKLLGIVTDGDIRRGLLRGLTLSSPIKEIIKHNPLVVPTGLSRDMIRQIMVMNEVAVLPEVDDDNAVQAFHTWDEFEEAPLVDGLMVIMAGGKGTRLRPYTEDCPKPMLPIRGKPMLLHIIERAKSEGFRQFILAINYLGHIIEDYFGDGKRFDVKIDYIREDFPLGTAGALSLFQSLPDKPFIVTNGDVITDIRYMDLLDFHTRNKADATMAVRLYEWQHPFGVVQLNGLDIVGFEEKPIAHSHINAGIYALSPKTLSHLFPNQPCNMPTLFERLKQNKLQILAYPMHEPWLDVGRLDDLSAANQL
jgi:dTDP-glucose pyrophosphorylase